MRVRVALESHDVVLEAIEIDHRDGRLDLREMAPDLALEQRERAVGRGHVDAELGRVIV